MKILGYNYKIDEANDSDSLGAFGKFNGKTLTLQIANDICKEQRTSTMLHEVLEAINFHLELELKHNVISKLEMALFSFLTDNNIPIEKLLPKQKK